MKKALIICNEFYPIENANTNCVYRIIDNLKERSYNITVFSVMYNDSLSQTETFHNSDIIRIQLPEQQKINRFFNKNKFIRFILLPVAKIVYWYMIFLKKHRIKKAYKEQCQKGNFDFILSVLKPDDNHELAYTIADKKTKWVMMNLDPYVYNYLCPHSIVFSKIREKKWLRKASGVINLDGIPQENDKNRYFPYKKVPNITVFLPNLELNQKPSEEKNKTFVIRYTGSLYNNKAENDSLIEFLSQISDCNCKVEFYGSCCNYLRDNYSDLPDCVNLMGFVPLEQCRELVFSADALINISTKESYLVPSKILEYIATGKPIINFYHSFSDPSFKYLDKYPLSFNEKVGENVDAVSELKSIQKAEILSNEILFSIYKDYLSENVVKKINDFIERLN